MVRAPRFHCWGSKVPSLVGELRSQEPSSTAKGKKKKLTGLTPPLFLSPPIMFPHHPYKWRSCRCNLFAVCVTWIGNMNFSHTLLHLFFFLFFFFQQWILEISPNEKEFPGISLVAQWLGISPPTKGTWVRALVQEDPTCRIATKPVCHNYWACALEPVSHNYRSPRA